DSNKTSNLEVGAKIVSKKNLSDNLTSTGQNTRTFGSGYISAATKIFDHSISSPFQLQNKSLGFSNYESSPLNKNIFGSGFINTGDSLMGKFVTQESPVTSIFNDTSYNEDENNRESNTENGMSFGMGANSLLLERRYERSVLLLVITF
ncbi:5067_t:CDS:2, partial [Acaulospora morrowiae]